MNYIFLSNLHFENSNLRFKDYNEKNIMTPDFIAQFTVIKKNKSFYYNSNNLIIYSHLTLIKLFDISLAFLYFKSFLYDQNFVNLMYNEFFY